MVPTPQFRSAVVDMISRNVDPGDRYEQQLEAVSRSLGEMYRFLDTLESAITKELVKEYAKPA